MGIDASSAMFLCAAKSLGVDFSQTAMIGRQTFWPGVPGLRRVFAVLHINRDAKTFVRGNGFAEEFFKLLGAKEISSFDVSAFEKASILHDMNLPLPQEFHQKFSCVYDGGTIEHVFNIPQAFKNCMELVKVGGHFTQVNTANNWTGHGFWQFSPELMFRVFSAANGFELVAVLMREVAPSARWYVVNDPDKIRSRVELCNSKPTYILTIAKRVAEVEIFKVWPQQSDYVDLWNRAADKLEAAAPTQKAPRSSYWKRYVPLPLKKWLERSIMRLLVGPVEGYEGYMLTKKGFRPGFYRRIDEDSLLRGTFL